MSPSTLDAPAAPTAPPRRLWARLRPAPEQVLFVGAAQCWHPVSGTSTPATPWADAASWCAAHPGTRLRVVLGGPLVRHLVAPEGLPLEDEAAVAQWARHQFVHYHGPAAQGWSLAPWCVAGQRGASALPAEPLQALRQAAAAHGVKLRGVQPWWPLALRALGALDPLLAMAPQAVLWLVEGQQVTRVALRERRVAALHRRWASAPTFAALDALLQQEQAASGEPGVPQWLLGCGITDGALTGLTDITVLGDLRGDAPHPRWWAAA